MPARPDATRDYPVAHGVAPPPMSRRQVIHAAGLGVAIGLLMFLSTALGWFVFQGPGARLMRGQAVATDKRNEMAAVDQSIPIAVPPKTGEPITTKLAEPPIAMKPGVVPANAESKPEVPRPTADLPAQAAAVSFEKHLLPILRARCANCHGQDKQKGGLDLRTADSLKSGGDNGPGVVPGAVGNSLIWDAVETNRMPPGRNKLNANEKSLIRKWIEAGAN